jgi:hypothetical protein
MQGALNAVAMALIFGFSWAHPGFFPTSTQNQNRTACEVTIGRKSPIDPDKFFGAASAHGNGNLYVGGLWPDGTIVFRRNGPGYVYPDGSLGMKIAWYRAAGLRGNLKISGKRLDAVAAPLRSNIPSGYSDAGFQPSEVIFPTEGCWQVTGTVSAASVTFVTRVARIR